MVEQYLVELKTNKNPCLRFLLLKLLNKFVADLGKSFVVVAQISDRKPRSRSPSKRRRPTAVEREAQEKIDRENRILLKKILEQHHGIRRSSSIPPASAINQNPHHQHHPKYTDAKISLHILKQGLIIRDSWGRCI